MPSSGPIDDDDLAGPIALLDRGRQACIDGAEDQRWVLRTTQVFERREDGWIRLHRHADPLIDRRAPAETFALASGRRPT